MYVEPAIWRVNEEESVTLAATTFTEVPWPEGARLMNECAYLFATEIREIEELTLGLTVV